MAPASDSTTITLAIEFLLIKGRRRIIPKSVKVEARSERTEKNCSLNPSSSISNQFSPGPGLGTALNTKIMIAVPIIVFLCFFGRGDGWRWWGGDGWGKGIGDEPGGAEAKL